MIHADSASRSLSGREVVRDVSFRVAPGEIVALLGPNGAGKTTTIRLLLGLLAPSSGSASVTRPCGYLPESFVAYDALTVAGYLRFCCRMKRLEPGPALDRALVDTDLDALASRPIARLSKGQRQRVGLAQAILGDPITLVLDEPTIGLDPAQVVDARRVLRQRADAGAAVLVSTHLLAEAASMCDRVVVLARGRVVAEEVPGAAGDLEARFLRLVGEAELS